MEVHGQNVDVTIYLIKMEFTLNGAQRCKAAKGRAKEKVVKWRNVWDMDNDVENNTSNSEQSEANITLDQLIVDYTMV